MSPPPAPRPRAGSVPAGFALRPATPADDPAIRELLLAAFGPDEGPAVAAMVDGIRSGTYARAGYEWVAMSETGRVVGHTCLSGTPLLGGRTVLMLSPLAVAAEVRRRGLGAALVHRVCALADAAGEPLVVLEGDPAYYGNLGFEDARPWGITLPLPGWAPPEAGQVRRLTAYDPRDRTLRGTVRYPAYVPSAP